MERKSLAAAVGTIYLNGDNCASLTEVESGKRSDRPALDKVKARVQQVHDELLTGLMEGKKK